MLTVGYRQLNTKAVTHKMSDNIMVFFSLEADVECQAVCTEFTPANQKQAIDSSMLIQQNLGLLLQITLH